MKLNLTQRIVTAILIVTGYRFSKYHRQHETMMYRLIGTTSCNIAADKAVL